MSAFYKELAELPTYTSAQFVDSNAVHATLSVRDHTRNTKRTLVKTIFVEPNSDAVIGAPSQELSDVVASVVSPSGLRRARLRELSDATVAGGKKRFVEIWHGDKLEVVRDVTASHGEFYSDDTISTLVFNPSETALLYTAEANPTADPRDKFKYVPTLGESWVPKKNPELFLFLWSEDKNTLAKIEVKHSSPSPVLFAKAAFLDDNRVYATGYEYSPDGRLLGLIWCQNRPAGVWKVDVPYVKASDAPEIPLQVHATRLTESGRSCRSVKILTEPYSSTLYWLSNPLGGPHGSTASLHSLNVQTNRESLLVDAVWDPQPNSFPGLYLDSLPTQPFLSLGYNAKRPYLVASSSWRSRSTVLLINGESGAVVDLTPDIDGALYSWTVLGTDGQDRVLASRSSPASPAELVLGHIDEVGRVKRWQVLDKPVLSPQLVVALSSLESYVVSVPDRFPVETIVIKQRNPGKILPTITYPHGGPHSASSSAFQASLAAYVLAGYTVSLPNYTGSTGFGQKYIEKLLGQAGTLDVNDVSATVFHLVRLGISKEGFGSQFIIGGSHGGFLAGHLIGQFPDTFTAASIRNPVISPDPSSTDIPDWYFTEFGEAYKPSALLTPAPVSAFPIAHVDKVRARVLLLIGEKDQRVTPVQGKNYYHALKARGKDVELLAFPEERHTLDGVEASKVGVEETLALFDKYRSDGAPPLPTARSRVASVAGHARTPSATTPRSRPSSVIMHPRTPLVRTVPPTPVNDAGRELVEI
ncbi:alpha/beta-hydrolase [Heliocybe sulcata]|uniref:Prolyl endopeptidase n=1 Tax=Heliocybe sulcata TaxID=5364 RepID=A0A5C3MT38_9AGAM|nr:alpha/beta-hydrolase [Heliocybe sulcata]